MADCSDVLKEGESCNFGSSICDRCVNSSGGMLCIEPFRRLIQEYNLGQEMQEMKDQS